MTFPRKIVHRDYKNRDHIVEAFDIMKAIVGIHVTKQTAAELKSLGIEHSGIERDDKPEEAIGVGLAYFIEIGKLLPDNILGRCLDCGQPIQYRPHFQNVSKLVCCFCAADRVLDDYWKDQP
jgi:hypothetical protein